MIARTATTRIAAAVAVSLALAACRERPPAGDAEEGARPPDRDAQAPAPEEKAAGSDAPLPEPLPEVTGEDGVEIRYETRFRDPVLEEMRERDERWTEETERETGEIRERQEKEKDEERETEKVLVASLPEGQVPASPDAFDSIWHFPPVAQYYTGTCWAFATTSFLESEVERISGRRIKLSEMGTVYREYLAKAERFVAERGESLFAEGSEANAVTRIWKEHGVYPAEAYGGVLAEDGRHDHIRMFRDMEGLMSHARAEGLWHAPTVLGMLRVILDRHMGPPPERFVFEGESRDPVGFMRDVLGIDPDDYVEVMSTMSAPFWKRGVFDVPDNWWRDDGYHNVPLDDFYEALKGAVRAGFGASIAVDVSEPGKDAESDAMFVPQWDIPAGRVDQAAREYRMAHEVTTDDHGVHLVGYARHADRDWFLVKDSGRSSRRGRHEGYYFVRGDYVRLKVMAYTVHEDAVRRLLERFDG